ncbi:MAG: hypothetical protein NE330_18745 [Lentisphaeraceae bacterium]|nr:hypothetical protein [Lentisphaeraceae bacterium]
MSSRRLTLTTKAPAKSFFTMVELIAVISITAILLTITIKIMKTDSTKANAQLIGGSLTYAQAYAMSKTVYTIIEITDSNGDSKLDLVTVKEAENSGTTAAPNITEIGSGAIQKEDKLVAGCNITANPGVTIYIAPTGEPIDVNGALVTAGYKITLEDNKNSAITVPVNLKGFTGKVTYY